MVQAFQHVLWCQDCETNDARSYFIATFNAAGVNLTDSRLLSVAPKEGGSALTALQC